MLILNEKPLLERVKGFPSKAYDDPAVLKTLLQPAFTVGVDGSAKTMGKLKGKASVLGVNVSVPVIWFPV